MKKIILSLLPILLIISITGCKEKTEEPVVQNKPIEQDTILEDNVDDEIIEETIIDDDTVVVVDDINHLVDPSIYDYWVVVYDQYDNELSRTTAHYGDIVKDPEGNDVKVITNTYFHTIVDYSSSKEKGGSFDHKYACTSDLRYGALISYYYEPYESDPGQYLVFAFSFDTDGKCKFAALMTLYETAFDGYDVKVGDFWHIDFTTYQLEKCNKKAHGLETVKVTLIAGDNGSVKDNVTTMIIPKGMPYQCSVSDPNYPPISANVELVFNPPYSSNDKFGFIPDEKYTVDYFTDGIHRGNDLSGVFNHDTKLKCYFKTCEQESQYLINVKFYYEDNDAFVCDVFANINNQFIPIFTDTEISSTKFANLDTEVYDIWLHTDEYFYDAATINWSLCDIASAHDIVWE